MDPEAFLRQLFDCAVKTADPMVRVRDVLPEHPTGKTVVVGAGKASARMAEAVESKWGPCQGLVITRYGYARPCRGIEIIEAAHPVPDQSGARATRRMLDLLHSLGHDDTVLALISGGGSALLISPAGDITLPEKQKINADLLASGAAIGKMNIVRKHLSRVKGGQLAAAAYPAKMIALMISDVPGDDPASIASGPTVGDVSSPRQAQAILQEFGIHIPPSVQAVLNGDSGVLPPDAQSLRRVENIIVAAPSQSLAAAAKLAQAKGMEIRQLGDALEGEARTLAQTHAALAMEIQGNMEDDAIPVLLLSGGECTVTRRGNGIGGPNAEYSLAAVIALGDTANIHGIACDTDGVDGAAEVAGAVFGPTTLSRAEKLGMDPRASLDNNDSHSFFERLKDQVVSGPTLTNVNDFRAILIYPAANKQNANPR